MSFLMRRRNWGGGVLDFEQQEAYDFAMFINGGALSEVRYSGSDVTW